MKESSQEALCLSCHGTAAAGSDLNVSDGVQEASGLGLRGGGFSNALMDTGVTGTPASAATTSSHRTDGVSAVAWGGGPINASTDYGDNITLECSNCHNPHGSGQYRILRPKPKEGDGSSDVLMTDEAVPDYDIGYNAGGYRDVTYAPTNTSAWCSQCHTRHLVDSNGAETDSGDAVYTYRHYTDGLSNGCFSCHVAHGTVAAMGTYSSAVTFPDGSAGDSRLLHVDSRGVCMQCHDPGD